jgi:hypothetical protein
VPSNIGSLSQGFYLPSVLRTLFHRASPEYLVTTAIRVVEAAIAAAIATALSAVGLVVVSGVEVPNT